ncbi:Zinc finger CCCH domain-containing protein 36 [Acorus calamus]|uniref:Zinc finger CCCH domain-containing protein 36 n=1 Tax=Acorus calamus TaxID=4465 RepID=A0AAV9FEN2_ACOCL|nr:Zinc finger CCCH domain-containing protein 36 [Acorus calamus]
MSTRPIGREESIGISFGGRSNSPSIGISSLHQKLNPHFNLTGEKQSINEEFISRGYLQDAKMHGEGGEYMYDQPTTRGSPLPKSSSISDYNFSSGNMTQLCTSSWEPSVPFRSSFYCASASISSPGSQYDPLLDSIEPQNEGKTSMQIFPGGSYHQASSDSLLTRSINPGSNIDEIMHSIPRSHEGSVERNASFPGPDGYGASAAATGNSKADFKTKSVHKEKHSANTDHVMEVANVNKLDSNSPKDQVNKVKENKEPKALKFFRAALVESVKELVKPFWREGHLSKDAHKTIVKKAVDKVLGALQSHQIPSNTEAINLYLSSSQPKLMKLVEGYVEKYSKIRVPDEKQV